MGAIIETKNSLSNLFSQTNLVDALLNAVDSASTEERETTVVSLTSKKSNNHQEITKYPLINLLSTHNPQSKSKYRQKL